MQINHIEALELAQIKYEESNLARCYVELTKEKAKQAKELEALRGFANDMYECWSKESEYYMEQRGLIDENGNPTKLLTGEK